MKKTFNNFRTLAALLMAGAAFAACSSDDNIIENQQPATSGEQVYTLTINASKGDGTTRALDLDGTGKLTASWTNGDELTVVNQTKSYTALGGTLTASNASGSTATFSGALTGTIEVNDVLILNYHQHNYFTEFPNQDGTLKGTNGAEKYDVANAEVTVASVDVDGDNKTITTTGDASFKTWTAMLKLTLQDNAATPNKLNATSLSISVDGIGELLAFNSIAADASTANGDGVLYFALPNAENVAYIKMGASPSDIAEKKAAVEAATVTFTATVGGNTYTATKPGYKFTEGKYYAATLTMVPSLPAGALAGKFTIDAGGTQVYFSQGNLQYQASTDTWRFAEHQYDYVGNAAGNNTSSDRDTQSGWIDLFGWGTSGKTFASGYGTAYQPWTTSTTNNQYGPTDGTSGLTDDYANGDWGVNMGTGWRTLTSGEWSYLFNTRTTGGNVFGTTQARYTEATINTDGTGVNGIILFPDGVDIASGEVTTAGTVNSGSAWATKCTTAQWAALESKGCVFLPAAGYRSGTSVTSAGSIGLYWSSTPNGSNNAYALNFMSNNVIPVASGGRRNAGPVRLVQEVVTP